MTEPKPCTPCCDITKVVRKGRATWLCAKCGMDMSLEYLFYVQATNPEWSKS